MNKWTHAICKECWTERMGGKAPVHLLLPQSEVCCYCGSTTFSGIYVREDPEKLMCKGRHE